MNDKKTWYSILLLIILFCGAWYLFNLSNNSDITDKTKDEKKDVLIPPKLPKFIFGLVSRVEGNQIYLKVGEDEKSVILDNKTVITKQVKKPEGYVSEPVLLENVIAGMQMMVYFTKNSGSEYRAERIQIL